MYRVVSRDLGMSGFVPEPDRVLLMTNDIKKAILKQKLAKCFGFQNVVIEKEVQKIVWETIDIKDEE